MKQLISDLPVRIYTPEPMLRHPSLMLRELFRDILAGRELAWQLFARDVKAQYRQSYLGYIWAFLPPLVSSLTFIFLNSQGIIQIEGTGVPYPAFAMMGTLLWQVFMDAMLSPSQALSAAKPMLTKINFPREAILVAGFYMVLFNFGIRLVLLAGVMLAWGIQPSGSMLLFPAAMAGLLACGYAIGLMLLPVGSLYGDVSRLVGIVGNFWMLLTPVVYPARTDGLAGILARWNPVSPLIVTARESLTGQSLSLLPAFAMVSVVSIVLVVLGLIAFRIAMPHLIARMGG